MPASGHLLCYACGMWPCGKECRLHSNSNRRAPDVRVSAAVSKEEQEQEAWYQLEHKAPLKSFGDKAYSVSVFNHSVRADCSWSVSQKTIGGITMLTPTGMVRRPHPTHYSCNIRQVLSKIAIAFGREDYPYAWKTDIDGSDVLFGWARVNGDLRYIHP